MQSHINYGFIKGYDYNSVFESEEIAVWNVPAPEKLATIPRLYETENVPLKDKVIHLHFFIGGCDWYIAEFDGSHLSAIVIRKRKAF
jgi:hypothetical protein